MRRFLSIVLCVMLCMVTLVPMASADTKMAKVSTGSNSGVNLRVSPQGTGKGWVPEGTSVEVISTSGNWCRVRVIGTWVNKNGYSHGNSYGYIWKAYVSVGGSKKSSNVAAQIGATGNTARTKTATTLRSGAGNGYGKVASLAAGAKLMVSSSKGTWAKVIAIRSGGNKPGYVLKSAIAKGFGGTTTAACNMRAGGSTSFGVVGSVPMGATVTILYVGSTWSQIRYGGTTGYVKNSYLRVK